MAKGLTTQAKTLSDRQVDATLAEIGRGRHPERDTAAFLLSVRAGLRAKEVAGVTWSMVTDGEGHIADELRLTNAASKGKNGGRVIDLNRQLKMALVALHGVAKPLSDDEPIVGGTSARVRQWLWRLYRDMGYEGYSSHSGRRTAITRWARKITEAGGSLKDVQDLAGHADLATTQRYIEVNKNAKRKVVNL
jgi:integrase